MKVEKINWDLGKEILYPDKRDMKTGKLIRERSYSFYLRLFSEVGLNRFIDIMEKRRLENVKNIHKKPISEQLKFELS